MTGIRSKRSSLLFTLLTAVFSLSFPGLSGAFDVERPEVAEFVQELADTHDFEADYIKSVLQSGESQQSILDAISKPAEKTISWGRYRNIFIQPERIAAGVEFWKEHEEKLNSIQAETGVPPEMIVAIIGVESYFGRHTGKYSVVEALATLGFDYPPRASFFRGELGQAFLLSRENELDINELMGSYAGAIGPPQFIPSSYRHYAVDGDGDGRVDLFGNWDDILMSVANYFKVHHWRAGEAVATQATLRDAETKLPLSKGLKPSDTVASLSGQGILFSTDLDATKVAKLFEMEADNGPEYWVGFHNFYVITRYNHSSMYALAAYQLGQAIASEVNKE